MANIKPRTSESYGAVVAQAPSQKLAEAARSPAGWEPDDAWVESKLAAYRALTHCGLHRLYNSEPSLLNLARKSQPSAPSKHRRGWTMADHQVQPWAHVVRPVYSCPNPVRSAVEHRPKTASK